MRCQTPSRYASHAIVRLIGSALAAASVLSTMVEKRPLPISEERERDSFPRKNPFFRTINETKEADRKDKKNNIVPLHLYSSIQYLFNDLYNVSQIIVIIYHFRTRCFFAFPFVRVSCSPLDLFARIAEPWLSLSVPAKNKWRRWAGGRSRSIIPAN